MTTAPTCNWDLVFGATTAFMQDVCDKNFSKNSQMNTALSAAPTISLNNENQIVFTCLPNNYAGAYDVELDLSAISVTPVATSTTQTFSQYQMCFTDEASFSVSVGSGGEQSSATTIAATLNNAVSNQCFPLETTLRRNADGIEIGANMETLLQALSPEYMAFASLVDSTGAAAGQLLTPMMTTTSTQPSESPFTAFSGSTALNITSDSSDSNTLYALWDYFLLNNLVKPKLADGFSISEDDISVSTSEPALLSVNNAFTMSGSKGKDVTVNSFTMQVNGSGITVSMTIEVEKDATIAGIHFSAPVNGSLTFTLAQTVDASVTPNTVGFEVIDMSASFNQTELAEYVSLGVANTVYSAFNVINPGPPISYIYMLIAFIIFAIVDLILLIILSIVGQNMSTVMKDIENKINEKLDDNRRTLKSAITINDVVYNCGTITFLTLDVDDYTGNS